MKILPVLEDIKKIAQTGEYRVVPVSCEILSDICTPIEAMKILKNVSTHCYMLESAQADEKWGRYTFLGYDPKMEITCMDGEMNASGVRFRTDDPSGYLRQILADHKSPRFEDLPFAPDRLEYPRTFALDVFHRLHNFPPHESHLVQPLTKRSVTFHLCDDRTVTCM